MCQYWYDDIKPKYGDKAKLFYTDTDNFIVYLKSEVDKPILIENNRKIIGLMRDELVEKMIKEIILLRPKKPSYLTDNDHFEKKAKGTKKSDQSRNKVQSTKDK